MLGTSIIPPQAFFVNTNIDFDTNYSFLLFHVVFLVSAGRSDILSQALLVVIFLAKWLPVTFIPEQFHVSSVRNDVL